jgi:hypothetical protein
MLIDVFSTFVASVQSLCTPRCEVISSSASPYFPKENGDVRHHTPTPSVIWPDDVDPQGSGRSTGD